MSNIDSLSREDLLAIMRRDRFVKEQLAQRISLLILENTELVGVIQELQTEQAASPEEATQTVPTEAPDTEV